MREALSVALRILSFHRSRLVLSESNTKARRQPVAGGLAVEPSLSREIIATYRYSYRRSNNEGRGIVLLVD